MNSNYQVAKFLANERVNNHFGNAKYHRLAKSAGKEQGNSNVLNNIPPVLAGASQRMIAITSHLVSTFGVWAAQ